MDFLESYGVFVFVIQFLGFIIKGLIGFGNPLFTAPALSMRLNNVVITPGCLLLDCPVNAYITWKNRSHFNWQRVASLLAAMMLGIIPGTLLLRFSMPKYLKALLGVIVIGLGVEMVTRNLRKKTTGGGKEHPLMRLVVAFFSGMCAGLFGINLFIVAYLERTAKDYQEFKGSMCFLFFGENLFRLCIYAITGLLTRKALLFGLVSAPAAFIGLRLSSLIGKHVKVTWLRRGTIVLFILGGVNLLIRL